MILCTGCGTRNEDAARVCQSCGRKLQSRWAAPQTPPDQAGQAGQVGQGGPMGEPTGGPWRALTLLDSTHVDEGAAKLVRACAETWAYALILLAGAGLTMFTENWLWLGIGVVVAGVLAWARGI